MRELTSKLTFFYKIALPILWIGMVLGFTTFMMASPESWDRHGTRSFIGLAIVGGIAFLTWGLTSLKWVSLDGDEIVISGYFKTIRVPVSNLKRVTARSWPPEIVWLHFRKPTRFGATIAFIPIVRFFGGFGAHPLMRELNALISEYEPST